MGYEGFSGNESILYHLHSPCRVMEVGEFTPIEREEWVPDAHVHHLVDTRGIEPQGDPINGRRLLMWNNDVEIAICRPSEEQDYFYKNGEGDEVVFVHEGRGHLETTFGTLAYEKHDYVVIPRSTIYRFRPEGNGTLLLTFHTPGRDRDAQPLPQPLRPAARARAVLPPRLQGARRAWSPTATAATTT